MLGLFRVEPDQIFSRAKSEKFGRAIRWQLGASWILALLFVGLFPLTGNADAAPKKFEIPELISPVMDPAGIFSQALKSSLDQALRDLQSSGGSQLNVLIVPSMADETIESASIKVADKWKLGKKGVDNGVLLIVGMQERKLRIEVGRGLEGQLTDLQSGRIIRDVIAPRFRSGEPSIGLILGVGEILKATDPAFSFEKYFSNQTSQFKNSRADRKGKPIGSFWFTVLFIFMFAVFSFISMVSRFLPGSTIHSRSRGWSSGGGGWTGGSGGGGGGWSGGGGGFGGGGASGDW